VCELAGVDPDHVLGPRFTPREATQ
jgi:conjugal transfer ATP-binding protein TraC